MSKDKRDLGSFCGSQVGTPRKVNYKAIDKFVSRQELARCLKKEKEIYEQKLQSGK